MMKNSWLKLRKDFFLRDLFQDFFDAKIYFDKIYKTYKDSSSVPFKMMDTWVGTEKRNGAIWTLKEQSHRLFRNTQYESSLFEHLFDWIMGSIFHEAMKLKEDSYQVESYKPLLELEVRTHKSDKTLSKIINEYFFLIEKANQNLKDELKSIDELFSKAIFHLQEIFVSRKDNVLLVRFLLDNKKAVEKIFGKNSFTQLTNQMFPEGIHEAFLLAAEDCAENGWYDEAEKYLKNALKADAKNKKAQKLFKELQDKLSLENAKEKP
jgi:hypothetical protein